MIVKHEKLNAWVKEVAELCQPDTVHWCDGSPQEYDRLMQQMVASGMATPLKKRPNSFLFRSPCQLAARSHNIPAFAFANDGSIAAVHQNLPERIDPLLARPEADRPRHGHEPRRSPERRRRRPEQERRRQTAFAITLGTARQGPENP